VGTLALLQLIAGAALLAFCGVAHAHHVGSEQPETQGWLVLLIVAAAALYGLGISQHLAETAKVKCPLQLHYGLKDQHVPQAEVDAVAACVRGRGNVEVLTYPEAGHSFANPVRPTYDPAAAKLANERVDAMLRGM